MSESQRNSMVGAFVLLALGVMGTLIIWFGEAPYALVGGNYEVKMVFPRSAGIATDTSVFMNDERIGFISDVRLADPGDPAQGVLMVAQIEQKYSIPLYSVPTITPPTLGTGKSTMGIVATPEMKAAAPQEQLAAVPKDGSAVLNGRIAAGLLDVSPRLVEDTVANINQAAQEVVKLAGQFERVGNNLDQLTMPISIAELEASQADPNVQEKLANLSTVLQRFDQTLKHVNSVVGKAETQRDIEEIIQNVRTASRDLTAAIEKFNRFGDQATTVGDRAIVLTDNINAGVDEARLEIRRVSGELVDLLNNADKTVDELKKAALDLSSGDGTVGRLLRDKRLYEGLVITTERLKLLLTELAALAQEWKRNGVNVRF